MPGNPATAAAERLSVATTRALECDATVTRVGLIVIRAPRRDPTNVDVSPYVAAKRAALKCHRSQTTDIEGLLGIPEEWFGRMFGTEWFVHKGEGPGIHEDALAGLG